MKKRHYGIETSEEHMWSFSDMVIIFAMIILLVAVSLAITAQPKKGDIPQLLQEQQKKIYELEKLLKFENLEEINRTLTSQEVKIKVLSDENEKLKSELERARRDEERLNRLQSEKIELENRIREYENSMDEEEKNVFAMERENREAQEEIQFLKSELERIRSEYEEQQERNNTLNYENAQLKDQINSILGVNIGQEESPEIANPEEERKGPPKKGRFVFKIFMDENGMLYSGDERYPTQKEIIKIDLDKLAEEHNVHIRLIVNDFTPYRLFKDFFDYLIDIGYPNISSNRDIEDEVM